MVTLIWALGMVLLAAGSVLIGIGIARPSRVAGFLGIVFVVLGLLGSFVLYF